MLVPDVAGRMWLQACLMGSHPVGWTFRLRKQQAPQSRSPLSSMLHKVRPQPGVPCKGLQCFHGIHRTYWTPACAHSTCRCSNFLSSCFGAAQHGLCLP